MNYENRTSNRTANSITFFLSEMFSSCILFPNALSIHYLILMQMCCPILRILGNQDEFEIFIKKTVDQPTYLEPVWADLKK